jgi:hypothetical protein
VFYQYSDELTTIEPQDRDPNLVCAAYITLAELDTHYEKFGFSPSTVQQCKEENRYFRSNIEVYDDYSFGTLKITDAANARAREDCLAFYVKRIFCCWWILTTRTAPPATNLSARCTDSVVPILRWKS